MTTNDPSTPPAETQTNVVPLPQPEPSPQRKVANFVHEHPIATIAGGLALGAVAAALIPRRNRKFIARKTSIWADAVAAASGAIAQQAISHIEAAASGARAQAHSLADHAEHAGHAALDRVERAGHSSLDKARSLLNAVPASTLSADVSAKARKLRERLHR